MTFQLVERTADSTRLPTHNQPVDIEKRNSHRRPVDHVDRAVVTGRGCGRRAPMTTQEPLVHPFISP
ncbi:hypothetical protein [Lentzea aerocolonigenes]|uniref:hypothetical protein n=1 Tax=Lentzea aerocolonigenes TaxID=68170 RepID=UPI0012E21BD2|nr:hypothetical protein [Lentzea aerocolonigenes]